MDKNLIKKLKRFMSDSEVAKFIEQTETNTRLNDIVKLLADSMKNRRVAKPGPQGEAGKTPVKGVDYFTESEIAELKRELIELCIPEKGIDYFTAEDVEEFVALITPVKGQDYFTPDEIKEFKRLVTPKKGVDYKDGKPGEQGIPGAKGKDGSPDTAQDIADKLNEETHIVEHKVIKGLEDYIKSLIPKSFFKYTKKHGGGGGGDGGGGSWTPQGVTTDGTHAVPAGTDLGLDPLTTQETFDKIFYPPNNPQVTLATDPASGLVEKGIIMDDIELTPTTVMGGAEITTLTITGTNGFNESYDTPIPTGGTEASKIDTVGFSTTTSYTATVTDANGNTDTDTKTYTYVFPWWKGVGLQNISAETFEDNGGPLTKVLSGDPFTIAISFTTTVGQVPYILFPVEYGYLKNIKDANLFNVSSAWGSQPGGAGTDIIPRDTVSVLNDYGVTQDCYLYEFENPAATTMVYTFLK